MLVTLPVTGYSGYAPAMTQAPPVITESYSPETLTDHELLLRILAEVISLRAEIASAKRAWATGGVRGLRRHASGE